MSRRDEQAKTMSWVAIAISMLTIGINLGRGCDAHAAPRAGSYASQRWDGAPLNDSANVALLARFDDVTLELVPFAQGVDGLPHAEVPLMLRRMNPNIRLWAYVLVGDFWLSPSFIPNANDRSAYRDIFDALNAGNGWLYDTNGSPWDVNYRVNLADSATVRRLGDVYVRLVKLRLFDGIFLDCVGDIWWTQHEGHRLDVQRAGFATIAQVDSARSANTARLIARLHEAGGCGFLVAANGVPAPGADVDFREGFPGSLTTFNEARRWLRTPGMHWLKADGLDCEQARVMLRAAALGNPNVIISAGNDRAWPPCPTYPERSE